MAIKSSDQISIVDLTDGYSVVLTSDGYTFPGTTNAAKAGSCTTQVIAIRGSEQIAAAVTASACTVPTGITVSSDNNATSPTLTITASTSFTAAGVVKIPVKLENGSITVNKTFSVGIAFTGAQGTKGDKGDQGDKGDTGDKGDKGDKGETGAAGADAITMSITSSAGTIFKNSDIITTLTAHVYKAGVEVTGSNLTALGTIKWYKDGSTTATSTGQTLTISAGQVTNKATYVAQLEA